MVRRLIWYGEQRGAREAGRGARRGVAGRLLAPLLIAVALIPASLAAQETRPRDRQAARPAAVDTLPADTTLTDRERALRRLRAMRVDPVEPDTTAADSLTADSAAVDTASDAAAAPAPSDSLAPAVPETPPDTAARPGVRERREPPRREPGVAEAAVSPGGVVEVEDTLVVFEDDDLLDRDEPLAEDSVRVLLRGLRGYAITEYTGETAVFRAENNQLELSGQSRVGQGGSAMETDSLLVYDGERGVVCGYGEPVLSGEAEPIESDEVCFNIERNLGVAVGARTKFQQQGTWYVRGADNRVFLLTGGEKNALYGERTEFTSCELDHPHYTFQARSVKMVEDEMMVARDVTLQFEDVPVFWLPWMVQSMKRGRRSGLLMPEFGVNDIVRNGTGYNRHLSNLGFYWAVNDYVSAKGTFEWYSGNWTALEGAVTYRWLRQFLNGNLTAKQYWRQREGEPGSRELTLNTSNSWQPDERTRVQLNANYASSTDFVQRNSFDPRELNRRITSSASVNRTFDWGSMSVGADRSQQLSTGQVDWKLPGVNVNISPVTLFDNGEGLDLTWSGSGGVTRRTRQVADTLPTQDQESLDANYSHRINFGNLGLSQSVSWSEDLQEGRLGVVGGQDTLTVAGPREPSPVLIDQGVPTLFSRQLTWRTSLSYQQVLWPGTTLSPSLSINGRQIQSTATDTVAPGQLVAEPNRISAGASLNTSVYGFWPGFGRFSRIRHKIAPSLSWSYSPAPEISPLQEDVFGSRSLSEQNVVSLSFNQTFEAKVRSEETDTAAVDTAAAEPLAPGERGEPRLLPTAQKVMLLALDTNTRFQYDFVSAREEGRGFLTEEISNSIRSDLLKGLQVRTTHSLFRKGEAEGDELAPRTFDPFLTRLDASFSIDNDFWLFDVLGLTNRGLGPGQGLPPDEPEAEGVANSEDPRVGAEADPEQSGDVGSIIPNRGPTDGGIRPGVGQWRASLSYSLVRGRPGDPRRRDESQFLRGNLQFDPTEHWSVRWSTGYSFTDSEFADHVLTLSRDLHRWQANFDFVKAQNGNFRFSFRVQLRDNPDLKLDYDQENRAEIQQPQPQQQ